MAGFKQGGIEFKQKTVVNPSTGETMTVYRNQDDKIVLKTQSGQEFVATETFVQNVSAGLQFQIDNLSGDFLGLTDTPSTYTGADTYVVTVSGNSLTFTPQSEIIPTLTEGALSGALDGRYVNVTGDTMTGDLTLNADAYVNGNVTILGDIIQISGNNYTQIAETLLVQDNLIVINSGETQNGVALGQSGFQVDRGTAQDYYFLFDESIDNGSFVVGLSGQLQPVATREETPINGAFAYWNDNESRFVTSTIYTSGSIATQTDITNLRTDVDSISGQVLSNDLDISGLRTDVNTISGDLNILETYTSGITGGLTQLDDTFVNISGDTMTGSLTISGGDLNLPDLITTDENFAQINDSGTIITTTIQELYVPVEEITGPNATGVKGQWSYGLGYKYECIATNTWIKYAVVTSW